MIPFSVIAGHVLLHLGPARALLDTGSPCSFGRVATVALPWGVEPVPPADLQGRRIAEVSQALAELFPGLAGLDLDLLLGCDLLAGQRLILDWTEQRLLLRPLPRDAAPRSAGGLPACRLRVAGRWLDAVVDTGAHLSYLRPGLVPGAEPCGSTRDFHFLGGRRQLGDVSLVTCPVELDGVTRIARFGLATGPVEAALRSLQLGAVLGTDLLQPTGRTVIDVPRRP